MKYVNYYNDTLGLVYYGGYHGECLHDTEEVAKKAAANYLKSPWCYKPGCEEKYKKADITTTDFDTWADLNKSKYGELLYNGKQV